MSDGTPIEWADATLNVVNGCSIVSPGCTNCYAMRSGARGLPNHPSTGLTKPSKAGYVWTGEVRFNEKTLLMPLRWKRPRKIFWNAHGDLFHDNVPDEWIDRCFAVMALTQHHIHQVLTKRPERMRDYMRALIEMDADDRDKRFEGPAFEATQAPCVIGCLEELDWPLGNIWLGVSVEDQERADERIRILLDTPAAVRWLSCEPLLGPVDLNFVGRRDVGDNIDGLDCLIGARFESFDGGRQRRTGTEKIDWVVAGGESGPGARPMHPDWARSLRDQCATAGVPFLFKQWGEHIAHPAPTATWRDGTAVPSELQPVRFDRVGKKRAGRLLDGAQHDGFPP